MIGTKNQIITHLLNEKEDKKFEIKEYREKRSKSQNAYMWELINQIANKVGLKKEEVYFQMLKDYGQSSIISVQATIDLEGFIKHYEEIGQGEVNGKKFKHYKVYKGSSEYDTCEMKVLIDGVIEECKQLRIETLTPEQIASMRVI